MYTRNTSKAKSVRRFLPERLLLEDRTTPVVQGIGVLGVTPGAGGAGNLSIAGVIDESSAASAATLTVSYEIKDSVGDVLASGNLTPRLLSSRLNLYGVSQTIPLALAPGSTETIMLVGADADSGGMPLATAAQLVVSGKPHLTSLGLSYQTSSGDSYSGAGYGHLSIVHQPSGGFVARGDGIAYVATSPNNSNLWNATTKGYFTLGVGPLGNLGLHVSQGTTTFNYGSYAGDTTATGGIGAVLKGGLSIQTSGGTALTAHARGSLALSATFQDTQMPEAPAVAPTPAPAPSTIQARAQNVALGIIVDTSGNFVLHLSGALKATGYLGALNANA